MSQELIEQYKQLHASRPDYGSGASFFNRIHNLMLDYKCRTMLDYGCGKGMFVSKVRKAGKIIADGYDPAVPTYNLMPRGYFDAVVCLDVLEHIPVEEVDDFIRPIAYLCNRFLFFNISCREAKEVLPNGENAHCTVRSPLWWSRKIAGQLLYPEFVVIEYSYHPRNQHMNLGLLRLEAGEEILPNIFLE